MNLSPLPRRPVTHLMAIALVGSFVASTAQANLFGRLLGRQIGRQAGRGSGATLGRSVGRLGATRGAGRSVGSLATRVPAGTGRALTGGADDVARAGLPRVDDAVQIQFTATPVSATGAQAIRPVTPRLGGTVDDLFRQTDAESSLADVSGAIVRLQQSNARGTVVESVFVPRSAPGNQPLIGLLGQ